MKKFSKKQWIKFSIAAVLYLLFTLWMQNAWLLLGLIVLVDIFLTGYIPWGAWKRTKNPQVRNVLEWVDDILFALVAVYFINIFIFQNYQIPSSSLEKSLLVGDYLFVSKLSYGPRVPNTPVAFPLVQNTLPFFNCKSYLDWPEWDYKRVKGLGHVKRNDIVVFNFPAGDTVALKVQNPDYYHLVEQYGREAILLNKADFGDRRLLQKWRKQPSAASTITRSMRRVSCSSSLHLPSTSAPGMRLAASDWRRNK